MRQIVKIDVNDKVYGGRIYENEVVRLLQNDFQFKRVYLMKYKLKILNILYIIFQFFRYKFFYTGTLFLTNSTTFMAGLFSKNVVVIHHVEQKSRFQWKPKVIFQYLCDKYLFCHKRHFHQIIVVSEYWKQQLIKMGLKNISVIYNSFDIRDYQFTDIEIADFKRRFGLDDRPLIYLGSCREGKGGRESYRALKDLNVNFVTSGEKHMDLPVPNLELSYRDYKLLLAASDIVIAMSLFNEGWNRVVHEASLAGCVVIGTNPAGMGELMAISKQIVVKDFSELNEAVKSNIHLTYIAPDELVALNNEYFRMSWKNILEVCFK